MSLNRFILCFLFSILINIGYGQKAIIKQANKYFEAEKYSEALELYNRIDEKKIDKTTLYRKAVSQFYSNELDNAIYNFGQARRMGYEEKEIYLYAGKSLHYKNLFVDASKFYKDYLRYVEDEKEKIKVIQLIKQCKFGLDNQYNEQIAFVENLGPAANSEFDELKPIQSPTSQNKYYFSSNRSGSHGGLRNALGFKDELYGNYSADMYAIELSGGNWTPASAFHSVLNGPKHDLIEGFNPDGSVMYFLQSQDGTTGVMYSDTFSIEKDPDAFPKQFESPLISELGDKDLQVFNNNTLLFSSKREGGYGGYDLYISISIDGEWQNPVNLGPEINSEFDEVDPFLTKSGTTLYFSTNRLESFGGFDVYQTDYLSEQQKWSKPNNLGMPINSAKDDLSFSISSDGMTAIFSSDRPESIGGFDLYLAYLKEQVLGQLLYIEAIPFLQSKKDGLANDMTNVDTKESNIETEEVVEKKEFLNSPLYYSKDEIILTPANLDKMKRVKDVMTIYPEMDIIFTGHSTKEGMREFDLYFSIKRSEKAADYLIDNGIDPNRITVKGVGSNFPHTVHTGAQSNSLADKNNRRIDMAFVNIPNSRLVIIEDRPVVSDLLKDDIFESYKSTLADLSYKIEIAKTKQMYKADVIRIYNNGIIEKRMDENSYTYTIGVFDTYNQARNLKNELIRKGIIDAKVVPYIDDRPINSAQVDALREKYTDLNEFVKFESD